MVSFSNVDTNCQISVKMNDFWLPCRCKSVSVWTPFTPEQSFRCFIYHCYADNNLKMARASVCHSDISNWMSTHNPELIPWWVSSLNLSQSQISAEGQAAVCCHPRSPAVLCRLRQLPGLYAIPFQEKFPWMSLYSAPHLHQSHFTARLLHLKLCPPAKRTY